MLCHRNVVRLFKNDKFLFDFEAIALTLNSVPRIIKEEYSHIIKSLDDNYNPLKDIFGE